MQHHRRDVRHRQQRLEFVVPRQRAVHVINALRQTHAHFGDVRGLQIMRLRQRQQRGNHRLHRAGRRPQPQRDLFQRPLAAKVCSDGFRFAAIGIGVVNAAVFVRENFFRRQKALLRQQTRHQTGQRPTALMKLNRRRAPVRKRTRRLTARQPKRHQLRVRAEAAQFPHSGSTAKRPHHTRRMPAARAERRVVGTVGHAHRRFQPGSDGRQQSLATRPIAFRNRQRR